MNKNNSQHSVAIIGAGPSGLFAAEHLAQAGFSVTVYDHKPSPARKFLMAGRGGLNITHSEPFDLFLSRYGSAAEFLEPALRQFSPSDLRSWCAGLGEETFIGTSGRVFPKSFKASPLLRSWLQRLSKLDVTFAFHHRWLGWKKGTETALFSTPDGPKTIKADAFFLALGGASWPRLGSDAEWVPIFINHNIHITTFSPSNCGFYHEWSPLFQNKYAGCPLKAVSVSFKGHTHRGEIMISRHGLEGGGIYALSSPLREGILKHGTVCLSIDLKPDYPLEKLINSLKLPRGRDSLSNHLRKTINLSPPAIGLLMEDRGLSTLSSEDLAKRIKSLQIVLTAPFPLDRAISSAGGINLDQIKKDFSLKPWPNVFVAGEMLNWEAPTGGYLLQACFSTAYAAAQGIISRLNSPPSKCSP